MSKNSGASSCAPMFPELIRERRDGQFNLRIVDSDRKIRTNWFAEGKIPERVACNRICSARRHCSDQGWITIDARSGERIIPARLDADGTAKGMTEIHSVFPNDGKLVGPGLETSYLIRRTSE